MAGPSGQERDDDRALVEACLAGSESAFRRLVEAFSTLVFGVCLRMLGDRHEAEDVAQEVFLRVHRSLRRWDGERPLRGWLLAIAANRCRTSLSQRQRRPKATEHLTEVPDHRPPDDAGELAAAIQAALAELRDDYRKVFLLFHEQGLSYEEMGALTGRPIGTLKTWLHRARAELLAKLRGKGLAPEERHDLSEV